MKVVKKIKILVLVLFSAIAFCQGKQPKKKIIRKANGHHNTVASVKKNISLPVVNENIPLLIPKKINGKFGFVNQKGKFVIAPEYDLVMFFGEDCNLLNSSNEKIKHFGNNLYATVEKNGVAFRINNAGKRVYQYRNDDLGRCKSGMNKALFHAYILNGKYGVIEDAKFKNPSDHSQFTIFPKYQYLYVLEGDDIANPMIIATHNDKFGVIDVDNKIVIPFEYSDIKRNYSWKLGKMFEVTKDDKNYYFIDSYNRSY
ncbi:WG repeat-containing protein [Chryseobacterium echinoideorum]|uniref:WG repeat-containing protein n=1 Tax=Chryseobacterium echinoideorum TaxID=1549648 RepID=UPI001185858B